MARRSLLLGGGGVLAAMTLPGIAAAQTGWPTRLLKIIDAGSAGGSTDAVARLVASKLGPALGQSVVVENKPGAGLSIGTDAVAKSAPDGYTLLLSSVSMCTNAASGKKQPFDFLKDLAPVGQIAATPLIIAIPAASRFRTLRELVDQARAKPDSVRYGSAGVGTMSHIGMEMFAYEAKAPLLHVPYRGVNLLVPDLLSGQIDAVVGTVASYSSLIDSGKLRVLAITGPRRARSLPEVPTSSEAGFPNYQVETWFGLMGPAGMPPAVVGRLNTELNAVLAQPDTQEALQRLGASPRPGTPEEFGRLNAFEVARWSKLIKDAHIALE